MFEKERAKPARTSNHIHTCVRTVVLNDLFFFAAYVLSACRLHQGSHGMHACMQEYIRRAYLLQSRVCTCQSS